MYYIIPMSLLEVLVVRDCQDWDHKGDVGVVSGGGGGCWVLWRGCSLLLIPMRVLVPKGGCRCRLYVEVMCVCICKGIRHVRAV